MVAGHRPGQASKVTVLSISGDTVAFTFSDPEDVEYFTVGGRFVAFFTPIGGDLAGETNAKPESST